MFDLGSQIQIENEFTESGVKRAIAMLERDLRKCIVRGSVSSGILQLRRDASMAEEDYEILVDRNIVITAADELGAIYGVLYLSEHFLGVLPFWFWMDQQMEVRDAVGIKEGSYRDEKPMVRFRGWFINDEILIDHWRIGGDAIEPWRMALEALLRCKGNLVIPGTDTNSKKYRALASSYGLWVTHHHAEPLGAEMFIRRFPDLQPNILEVPQKFEQLWEEAVIEQKDCKTVWTVGFRGQGDSPFWAADTSGKFNTSQARADLIMQVVRKQCDIVRKYVKNPVFCTNLYGEITTLYREGVLHFDDEIIQVAADNGFGKMVSRRQENSAGRLPSLPDPEIVHKGIYYHASFYDLQAAAHITMLPNSVDMVGRELAEVERQNACDYWLINCSNIRPHVYYLDAIRKAWMGEQITDETHAKDFVSRYMQMKDAGNSHRRNRIAEAAAVNRVQEQKEAESEDAVISEIAALLRRRPQAIPAYGPEEDEHVGDQFYNENVRLLAHQWIVDRMSGTRYLKWLTGDVSLMEQSRTLVRLCQKGQAALDGYAAEAEEIGKVLREQAGRVDEDRPDQKKAERKPNEGEDTAPAEHIMAMRRSLLYDATILLETRLHVCGLHGVLRFGEAMEALEKQEYQAAFVALGDAAAYYDAANRAMREAEYGVWKGFYANECFADYEHTAFMLRKLMGVVREFGDTARHEGWLRDVYYAPEDRQVYALFVNRKHPTDDELYEALRLASCRNFV